MRDAVLNSMTAEYSNNRLLGNIAFSYATVYGMSVAEVVLLVAMIVILLVGPWLRGPSVSDVLTAHSCSACNATAMTLTLVVPH